jgi:hypothetical protein
MMVDGISGHPSAAAPAKTVAASGSGSFNKTLSETASALANNAQTANVRLDAAVGGPAREVSMAKPVKIGTITSKNPTVSNLLIQNPQLKKDCWNIVYAQQNRDKAYTRIPNGTDIYYDPATKELLWGDMMDKVAAGPAEVSTPTGPVMGQRRVDPPPTVPEGNLTAPAAQSETVALNAGLVDAVEPLIGKSYADMDCYELLVNGLSRMGIRYYGRDGLGRQMVAGAVDKGLPMNAYLNGEGLIRFSGSETYRKSLYKVSDPVGQARQVMDEMAAHLEKGSILSFSTESRGHTGIVSNRNGAWTYINSGVMDNPVERVAAAKGVGEESLAREIENWFQLAARKNESLVITLGKLNQNRLAAYGAGGDTTVS